MHCSVVYFTVPYNTELLCPLLDSSICDNANNDIVGWLVIVVYIVQWSTLCKLYIRRKGNNGWRTLGRFVTKLSRITISSIHVLATPENDKVLTKHLCAQFNFFLIR